MRFSIISKGLLPFHSKVAVSLLLSLDLPILRSCRRADLNLNSNPFIETTLGYALSYVAAVTGPQVSPASVTILADNDYYSTPAELTVGSRPTSRFHNFGVPLSKAHKTGLGSSAALVTALTAALLSYYLPKDVFTLTSPSGLRKLHNLAQAAHCAAQGKVGSGFDVASAVYGSCLYRRFSPAILSHHPEPGQPRFVPKLCDLVDETGQTGKWDQEILKDAVRVPAGLRLVMCDVSCGSQTPGMVKKVLAWRKENAEEAETIWRELQEVNEGLAAEMKVVAEAGKGEMSYVGLRDKFAQIRRGIRLMSEKSGVPIEPPPQTELLDACERVEGVIGGVVPGAGGYDAISLLIEDKEAVISELRSLLASWKFKVGLDMEEGGGRVSMLGVRQDMEGVKMASVKDYQNWLVE